MTVSPQRGQRRLDRHRQTREEIVAHALDILSAQGVAGLSLGELARRMGVRTPSLYTYFESRNALFDELFRRGWEAAHEAIAIRLQQLGALTPDTDLIARALDLLGSNLAWMLDHAPMTTLMVSRPVPDWEPSPAAYASSLDTFQLVIDEVNQWVALGLVRADTDVDELTQNLISIGAGMIARQLANEPGVPLAEGRASRHFPALVTAYLRAYLPG